jgi:hypothetical protein
MGEREGGKPRIARIWRWSQESNSWLFFRLAVKADLGETEERVPNSLFGILNWVNVGSGKGTKVQAIVPAFDRWRFGPQRAGEVVGFRDCWGEYSMDSRFVNFVLTQRRKGAKTRRRKGFWSCLSH